MMKLIWKWGDEKMHLMGVKVVMEVGMEVKVGMGMEVKVVMDLNLEKGMKVDLNLVMEVKVGMGVVMNLEITPILIQSILLGIIIFILNLKIKSTIEWVMKHLEYYWNSTTIMPFNRIQTSMSLLHS